MSKSRSPFHILLLMAAMVLFSCKSKEVVRVRQLENIKPDQLVQRVHENQVDFTYWSSKASVSMNMGGEKSSFKVVTRVKRDSLIWMSFTYIGFAGAKVLITQDSVKVINYRESNYAEMSLDYISGILGMDVDFNLLQSLLIGNPITLDPTQKIRLSPDKDKYLLSTLKKRRLKKDWAEKKVVRMEKKTEKKQDKNSERGLERLEKKQDKRPGKYQEQVLSLWVMPEVYKISRLQLKDYVAGNTFNARYSEFTDVNNQRVPEKVEIHVERDTDVKIDVEYSKMSFDEPLKFLFNIPSKYERVEY